MTYSNEQILEKYKNLPEEVKDMIFNVDAAKTLREIGEKNKLNVREIGIVADETGLFMLGITHPNEFIPNLISRLGIEEERTAKVAHEINSQIFSKIRESLKGIHGNSEKTESRADISPQKNIFEERSKETIFQAKAETIEKNYPNDDPYREPPN
ncbi:hypothetical protein KKA27_00930 [Patescibacteria group bacterium]|nr:hypothetical protein [Patescibacteria group bacterium]MBU2633348.1 hypothetical protein [Patescibacteria group bacterium]